MRPKILLINPWIYDFAAFDLWAKPLGLLYIGAVLQQAGCEVRLVDCLDRLHPEASAPNQGIRRIRGTGRWLREIVPTPGPYRGIPRTYARYGLPEAVFQRALLSGPAPDLVLVTSIMTYWYPGCQRAIELVRQTWPNVKIVLGGTYATLCPDHARRFSGADLIIAGPGEEKILSILIELGVSAKETALAPTFHDRIELRPALDLYPAHEFAPIMTSRGCPFRCPYCASAQLYPVFDQRDPDDVYAEIEDRHFRLGLTDFTFYDDALLVNPESHLMPLLENIKRNGLKINFHAPNGLHVGLITADLAALMYETGFKTLRLGLETLDWDRQAAWGSKVRADEFESALACLIRAGFEPEKIGVYLLYGLPGQTLEEARRTALAVRSLGATPYLSEFSPLPGTALGDEAARISPYDLENEPLYHNNTFFPCRGEDFSWEKVWEIKRASRGVI